MKVSIVTVSFNSQNTISDTINSVLHQTYPDIEYIIVDGKSSDNTVNIIESLKDKFNGRLRFISEPDNGIYDAMNKGIKMATGEIVGLLNSDDIFASNTVIEKIADAFKTSNAQCVYGNLVVVDKNDPSFKNPSKPVGPFYSEKTAKQLMEQTGETYVEDAGRGYRKVVASPKPLKIVEIDTIKNLVSSGHIVIACGGGGIPIFKQNEAKGANAVIDKDLASSLMAENLDADILVILTNISQAEIHYGTPEAQKLGKISVAEAKKYLEQGEFLKGSMAPKIEAAISFVEGHPKRRAIITELNNLLPGLEGINSTEIYFE